MPKITMALTEALSEITEAQCTSSQSESAFEFYPFFCRFRPKLPESFGQGFDEISGH